MDEELDLYNEREEQRQAQEFVFQTERWMTEKWEDNLRY